MRDILIQIAESALEVRAKQARYFKERTQSSLDAAKRSERVLDHLLAQYAEVREQQRQAQRAAGVYQQQGLRHEVKDGNLS